MPNKPDPNKVHIGCYVDREIRDLIKKVLEEQGIATSDYIYYNLLKLLNRSSDEILEELKRKDGGRVGGKLAKIETSPFSAKNFDVREPSSR